MFKRGMGMVATTSSARTTTEYYRVVLFALT